MTIFDNIYYRCELKYLGKIWVVACIWPLAEEETNTHSIQLVRKVSEEEYEATEIIASEEEFIQMLKDKIVSFQTK